MTRAAIYARVSDKDKQGDNFSLPSQLDLMRAWCELQDFVVADEFTDKDSAFINGLDRPELNRMLEQAEKGAYDALIFLRSDRFTRDMGDGVILRRRIRKSGAKLFFYLPYPREISSDVELLSVIEDYASQRDAEKRREDSMRGYEAKVKSGAYGQGTAPYGYVVVGHKQDAHLELFEARATVVRQIYTWYAHDHIGPVEIARRLNEAGAETPGEAIGRRFKRDKPKWLSNTVLKILKEEVYKGTWYGRRYKLVGKKMVQRPREDWIAIEVPPIVSPALWDLSQERARNHGDHARNVKVNYLMRRRLKCGCGYSVQGRPRRKRKCKTTYYYSCASNTITDAIKRCGTPFFRVDVVDTTVWLFAKELLRDPERVLIGYQEAQQVEAVKSSTVRQQIAICDEQIAAHMEEMDSAIDMRQKTRVQTLRDTLDKRAEDCALMVEALTAKRAALIAQLTETEITDQEIANWVEYLQDIHVALDAADDDFELRRGIIEDLNLRATLRVDEAGEKWIDIHWLIFTYPQCVSKSQSGSPLTIVAPAAARSWLRRWAASRP